MAFEPPKFTTGRVSPEVNNAIITLRDNCLFIRAKHDGHHPIYIDKTPDFTAGIGFPEHRTLTITTVARLPSQLKATLLILKVACELTNGLSCSDIPEDRSLIITGTDQAFPSGLKARSLTDLA